MDFYFGKLEHFFEQKSNNRKSEELKESQFEGGDS